MATKIVTKNSSTASAVPTASDLVQGELAVNVADKRLFTEDNAGAIVELGTNPSALTVAGEITANGGIALGDNDKATFGAGDDLQLYHNGGSGNYIDSVNKDLYIRCNLDAGVVGGDILLQPKAGENSAVFKDNGAVDLYYDNVAKFSTTSTGIDVTGTATVDSLLSSGNVGIGTSSLTGGNTILNLSRTGSGAGCNMQFANSHNSAFYVGLAGNTTGDAILHSADGTAGMAFGTGNTERMRIDSSGNVLVGTTDTTPGIGDTNAGISMSAANGIIISRANDAPINISRNSSDGVLTYFRKDGAVVGSIGTSSGYTKITSGDSTNGSGLQFGDSKIYPVEANSVVTDNAVDFGDSNYRFKDLYLSGATKLFSGTNSPSANSTLGDIDFGARTDGTVTAKIRGIAGNNGNGTDGQITFFTADNTASQAAQERMRIDSSGNLTVGDSSTAGASNSACTIAAGGAITTSRAATNNQTHHSFVNPNGVVGTIKTIASQTSFNTSSDQRLKENIADAPSASSDIDAIQVRSFDWKADGSHQKYGMVAQELQTVAPEAVSQGETEEDMMGVDYSKLVPMLIKEIQSLRNRVAQLEE